MKHTHAHMHTACTLAKQPPKYNTLKESKFQVGIITTLPTFTQHHNLAHLRACFFTFDPAPASYAPLHLLCSLRSPLISFLLRCSHPTSHFPSPALLTWITFHNQRSHPTPHFPSPALLTRITFDLLPPQVLPSHPTLPFTCSAHSDHL